MGEPVHVAEHATARPGVIRFETDRPLTGMGHRSYASLDDVRSSLDAADEVARRLLLSGRVDHVHVYGNVVTVELARGATSEGLLDELERLFVHYTETEPPETGPPETGPPETEAAPEVPTSEASPAT